MCVYDSMYSYTSEIYGGGYWIAVCRIAVPIFLMISGYFYNKESAIKQIKKTGFLFIEANLLYGVWSCFYGVVSGVYPIINGNSILKFIFLNESPFSGHLWYLGAVLYTQIFVYTIDQIRMKKVLYLTIPMESIHYFYLVGNSIMFLYAIGYLWESHSIQLACGYEKRDIGLVHGEYRFSF